MLRAENGLFGWALAEIGFDVTCVAAAVMRADRGGMTEANHLALLVCRPGTDETWIANVFALDEPDITACRPQILERHEQLFDTS